jgi:2-polyprenyl-6-methoxyphenol hydroxylase-like FAD-dependent oxidoreductase
MDVAYASRTLRRVPGQAADGAWFVTISTPPTHKRAGVLFPIEGDRWIVTLVGFHGDHPPTDDEGFLAFARSLPVGDIASILEVAEPDSPIVPHRMPSSQWRHYEKVRRAPAGFVALGDAVCSFNPAYGQGMTSAALQVQALARILDQVGAESPTLPRRFYQAAKKVIVNPWQIAAGADFLLPETTGPKPPGTDIVNRYIRKVFIAAQHDEVVNAAMIEVQNLLAPPPSLMKPKILRRTLKASRLGPTGVPASTSVVTV